MTKFPVSGGCICGSVRYTVSAPAISVVHCHCSDCRRSYASLVGTGATISRELLEINRGDWSLETYTMNENVRRQFCKKCGCSLFYYDNRAPEVMFYFPATLDGGVHPGQTENREFHVHVDSRAEWESFEDKLSKFPESCGWDLLT